LDRVDLESIVLVCAAVLVVVVTGQALHMIFGDAATWEEKCRARGGSANVGRDGHVCWFQSDSLP
jgi:hypothetical protein